MAHARRPHLPLLTSAVAVILWVLSMPAAAQAPGILTDELTRLPGSLESLTLTTLAYRDANGTVQELDRRRLVRWTPPAPPAPPARDLANPSRLDPITGAPATRPPAKPLHATLTASHLVTTDGQAWLGTLAADQNQPEALGWTTALDGQTQTHAVPLERLRSVRLVRGKLLRMPAPDPDAPPQDRVLLQEGQVLAGFLVGLTGEAVQLILDGADEPVDIPLAGIHLLELATPSTPPLPGTDYAQLIDGQRHAFQNLRTNGNRFVGQRVALTGDATDTAMPRDQVTGIDFHAAGQRLVPLADLPFRIDQPAVVFGVPYPPALNADTADLHAPLQITFELPPGTTRFAARLELNSRGLSPAAARWADLTVRVSSPVLLEPTSDDKLTFRLNADTPSAELNLAIDPGPITLTLDPAANGPVLDRLRLLDAHVLTQDDTPAP